MNVVYILWLRQIKKYLRSRARVVASLAQPLLFLFALGYGLGPTYQKAGNGDYIQFLAPGVVAMAILFTSVFSGIEIIWDRQFGFLKETLVAPVPRLQIVLGRTLGGATVALIQGCIVFIFCLLAGFRVESFDMLPLALVFMFLVAMLFTSLGTVFGSLLEDMQAFPLIMNFLVMPIFFLSGALFPAEGLPHALHIVMRLDPLAYGVDGIRGTLHHGFAFGMGNDLILLTLMTSAILAIASYCFSKIQI